MPLCYICNQTYGKFSDLWKHLKMIHRLHGNSKFRCRENHCLRIFTNINSYRKHWSAQHGTLAIETATPSSIPSSPPTNVVPLKNPDMCRLSSIQSAVISQDHPHEPTPCDFQAKIKTDVLKLISNLYSLPTLPRSHIQTILTLFDSFFKDKVQFLRQELQVLVQNSEDAPSNIISKMCEKFDLLESAFSNVQTEHQRFGMLSNEGYLFLPRSYIVGRTFQRTQATDGHVNTAEVQVSGQIFPLRRVLKAIFEIPRVYDETMNHKKKLESDTGVLSNFIQGSLWKSKVKNLPGKIVLPLFVFFDESEVGNPLGSHAGENKLGGTYVSVPCFPPEYNSSISSMYHALIFFANDRKKFGNHAVFRELIQELFLLENEGIEVVLEKGSTRLYFKLGLIVGDNLGLNTILGFVESFSANFYCRFCKMNKCDMRKSCVENEQLLRNKESYNNDVMVNDCTLTGVKEDCVFHDLPDFHVVDNLSVDIMHDLFEGVCKFDMVEIVKYYTQVVSLFTLDDLNSRIMSYDYGPTVTNIPPEISEIHLKKNSIHMSASEMWSFVIHFGLMCGDMVPENDPVWQFYLTLRRIVALVTSPSVQIECSILLETLVEEHHEMFIRLFGKHLKPKNHNLTHYPRIMRACGPLIHLWSMRFESKHQESKITATSSKSRRNISLTISIKNQLKLSAAIMSGRMFSDSFTCGPGDRVTPNELPIQLDYNIKIPRDKDMLFVKWITKFGITYKPGMAICIGDDDGFPIFALIKYIIVDTNEILFIHQQLQTMLSPHFDAYQIRSYDLSCECINIKNMLHHMPLHVTKMYGQQFIVLRYYL